MIKKRRFYENKEIYGEIYDWNAIFKRFESLKTPDDVWQPRKEMLNSKYGVLISDRSIGKTSQILLLGLCQRAIYGTQICYVRATEAEFSPTEGKKLVSVINSYEDGRYIKELTGGKYNAIIYKARAFYYALLDEAGTVVDKECEECIRVLTVDRWLEYKSVLNMPKGDFFIFDEFVRPRVPADEFVMFCEVFKTVARVRFSPVIFMLANSISYSCPYYSELEIKEYVRKLKSGERISVTSEMGTKVYIERCALPKKSREKRNIFNTLFMGFKNPKLGAITGGQLWALPNVPHLYRRDEGDEAEYLIRNVYINYEGDFLRLDFVRDIKNGLHLEIVPGGPVKPDSVILTLKPPEDPRELYLLGGRNRPLRRLILNIILEGKCFFATNEEGSIFKSYIERALELERNPLI